MPFQVTRFANFTTFVKTQPQEWQVGTEGSLSENLYSEELKPRLPPLKTILRRVKQRGKMSHRSIIQGLK